ncbi:DUF6774 domain-containing protein [Anaerosporobacter faecicola]|uniref:DUF6774 domain-containing protein n=1 Tax=Anaerosporobacter faecicola TaxID=2718714 RepID=UPI00143C14C3|nr:DUF6774 domain-containing protein [Anaerosporobacter faecicola]
MNSCNLVASLTGIACTLSQCLSEEELNLLSASLVQLGDTIVAILANESYLEACCKSTKENDQNKSCNN